MGFIKKLGGDIQRRIRAKAEAQRKIRLERQTYQKIIAEKQKLAHRQAYAEESVKQARLRAKTLAKAKFQKPHSALFGSQVKKQVIKQKVTKKLKRPKQKYTIIGGKAYPIQSRETKRKIKAIVKEKTKPKQSNDLFWRL